MALLFELKQKLSQGFSVLWSRYPNKKDKKGAEKVYDKIVTPEIDEKIHAALDWQIPEWEALEWYTPPYLKTYLNQERWTDQPTKKTTINRPTAKVLPLMAQQQMDAASRIRSLVALGVSPEDAKQQVYRDMGWVKE